MTLSTRSWRVKWVRPFMKTVHLVVWYAIVAGLMVFAFWPGLISD